jgi:hypothetical protein
LRRSISCSAGHFTSLTARNPLPSGSQVNSFTPSARFDTFRASPPSSATTQICGPPWRDPMTASERPSGDQRGLRSDPGPPVNGRAAPVASSASQTGVVPRFSSSEYDVTV